MIVMKFGGTSVEDPPALARLADIVSGRRPMAPLIVVSAMGKTTNRLLECGALAARGFPASPVCLGEIRATHAALAAAVVGPADRTCIEARLDTLFEKAAAVRDQIASSGQLTPRLSDALVATGELASSEIVAGALRAAGLPAECVDIRPMMVTGDDFTRAQVRFEEAVPRMRAVLLPLITAGRIPVTQGFVGATASGETTTIGRGGSDYSASIIGAALDAAEIEIWTDVDGIMTTDPRLVPAAARIDTISFDEAAELAYFGARVLHPSTLRPAVARGIPVRVLNSRRPDGPGTTIVHQAAMPSGPVRAIAMKQDITVIKVTSDRMLMAHGFLARLFEVFSRHETSIDMVTTSEVTVSMTLDDTRRLQSVVAELRTLGDVGVDGGQAIVCLVGDGLASEPGLVARVFAAVKTLPVSMISHGASANNISFVVPAARAPAAVAALHAEFFGTG